MIGEQRLRPALGALVLLAALGIAALAVLPYPRWTPDGYAYAVRMLLDLGLPFQEALHRAQAFYALQPIAADPLQAPLFRGEQAPLYWDVFKPRVVYPFLCSLLFPNRGFQGMHDVSSIAYVASAVAVYYLALQFAGAIPSLVVTLGFAAFPGTIDLARCAQTDMLALLFSTLCLVALVRIVRDGGSRWPLLFAIAGLLLVFTRPAFYMLLGGSLGLCAGVWRGTPSRRNAALACAGAAVATTALYLGVALASGSPSFTYVIADARDIFFSTQPPDAERSFFSKLKGVLHFSADEPLGFWYAKMLVNLFFRELARAVVTIFPLVAFFGLATLRRDRAFWALAGTVLALMLVPFLDPISLDMDRVLEFPMLPVLAIGLVGAAASLQARLTDPNQGQVRKVIKKTSPGG